MSEESDPIELPGHVQDLTKLVIAYVKQETVEPIKGLKRFVGLGLAGSVLASVGLVLLFLGVLRLLQDEVHAFKGHLKPLPYVITVALCGLVAFRAVKKIGGNKDEEAR